MKGGDRNLGEINCFGPLGFVLVMRCGLGGGGSPVGEKRV